jgi:hypothetical protein
MGRVWNFVESLVECMMLNIVCLCVGVEPRGRKCAARAVSKFRSADGVRSATADARTRLHHAPPRTRHPPRHRSQTQVSYQETTSHNFVAKRRRVFSEKKP